MRMIMTARWLAAVISRRWASRNRLCPWCLETHRPDKHKMEISR